MTSISLFVPPFPLPSPNGAAWNSITNTAATIRRSGAFHLITTLSESRRLRVSKPSRVRSFSMKTSIIAMLLSCSLLSAEPAGQNDNYRLAPDDLLQVKVFREDDLDSTVRISKDGTVTLPLIGI